jgi:hypothetical protein
VATDKEAPYARPTIAGELELVKLAASVPNPSFLVAAVSGKFLYSTNEVFNFRATADQ